MPIIYLSPSTQEFNPYINGGTEEQYMNLLANYMEPYLASSGIEFVRNTPSMTSSSSTNASNSGKYDLHLALHSNASPPDLSGKLQGTDAYYSTQNTEGKRAADLIANNFKKIYPNPQLVKAVPTTTIAEVVNTIAPAVLLEIAYHDNIDDANWIKNNLKDIAKNIAMSVTEYLDLPFIQPQSLYEGTVNVSSGALNIRSRPTVTAPILAKAYDGEPISILGRWDGWYIVNYKGTTGYARADYIGA